ncbi:MAG: hypothetical protein AAGE83_14150, partial [Pseudomonadota bacterium]
EPVEKQDDDNEKDNGAENDPDHLASSRSCNAVSGVITTDHDAHSVPREDNHSASSRDSAR